MKVAVLGLWHLGSVTAACAAEAGHAVRAWDPDAAVVASLAEGRPPVFEPGLADVAAEQLASGRLLVTADLSLALADAEVAWLAFDTPVDDQDRADVEPVLRHARRALPLLGDGVVFLSSSQLPVGTLRALEAEAPSLAPGRRLHFACAPENLRLGHALHVFRNPDRVVVGIRDDRARAAIRELFAPITSRLEWMSIESAEMTKHAINAFLAASVTFINEVAVLCERVGADAKEVERGLKTEHRIGPHARLSPGAAFAGGTLARDVMFLDALGRELGVRTPLLSSVQASNAEHRAWASRALQARCRSLAGARVAVWGLTYKPGTDTLRRSTSVDLCRWLTGQGASVVAFDPAVRVLPAELRGIIELAPDAPAALASADALVVATEWPEFREVPADRAAGAMRRALVLDPNRFLAATMGAQPGIEYVTVGKPSS
jgi:UDPglucose 6-dehydrogenase